MRKKPGSVGPAEVQESAVALAFEVGLHAVTLERLAARLDARPALVTAHEPVIDALVARVFQRVVAAELAEVKRVVLAHPSPVAQLRALLDTLAEPVRMDVTAVWVEAWSLGRRNEGLAAAVRDEMDAWQGFVVTIINRGIRTGDFRPADSAQVAARMLGMIDGVNSYALVGYGNDIDRAAMLASIVEHELGAVLGDDAQVAPDAPRIV